MRLLFPVPIAQDAFQNLSLGQLLIVLEPETRLNVTGGQAQIDDNHSLPFFKFQQSKGRHPETNDKKIYLA